MVLRSRGGAGMVTAGSRSFRALSVYAFTAALGVGACEKGKNGVEGSESATPRSSAAPPVEAARRQAILSAEHRRSSRDILDADLSSRDVTVRRAAARALSRIADARAVEHLLKTLADEDDEVVTWSAYGLGFSCRGREDGVVKRLSARAASLLVAKSEEKAAPAPSAAKN